MLRSRPNPDLRKGVCAMDGSYCHMNLTSYLMAPITGNPFLRINPTRTKAGHWHTWGMVTATDAGNRFIILECSNKVQRQHSCFSQSPSHSKCHVKKHDEKWGFAEVKQERRTLTKPQTPGQLIMITKIQDMQPERP